MKQLTQDALFWNLGDLSTLPEVPPLRVTQGETFLAETVDTCHRNVTSPTEATKPYGPMAGNPWTGPVYVEGIKAGDVIAVHIEDIQVTDHCFLHVGAGSLLPAELIQSKSDFISMSNGRANFGSGLTAPIRPMFGCFGIVPLAVYADPWQHGGNLDIPDICAGSIVHLRCERDGAWFGCGDGHALQGEGEINGYSLEVSLSGQLRIEKSKYQNLHSILIETATHFITVGVRHEIEEAVKSAVYSMTSLLANSRNIELMDAYLFASHVGDIRLGAMWPWWSKKSQIPVPICLHLSKEYF